MEHINTKRVRLSVEEARALATGALGALAYAGDDAAIITAHLLDAALCGYEYSGLPKILDAVANPKVRQPRTPMRPLHDTPLSTLFDGGNHLGMLTMHRATEAAIAKARTQGIAVVGVTNSWMSGRSAYYMEMVARADLVGVLTVSASKLVAPAGGTGRVLGTNPIAFGFPGDADPVVVDLGTSAISWTDLTLRAHRGEAIPPGIALDGDGEPTTDAHAARKGAILPFGGSKGFALAFAVQALGVLAGSSFNADKDYGFLLIALRPDLLVPLAELKEGISALVARVHATSRAPGVDAIRVPSERAFRERVRRRVEGIEIDSSIHQALQALATRPG
jgi:LDH2 family malate/lactate/ureidoglycolate dehydrogenase